MAAITLEGLEELEKYLQKNAVKAEAAKKVVKTYGSKLQTKAQRNAVFRGHYEWERGNGLVFVSPSGTLKRSIGLKIDNDGLRAVVEPTAHYAGYVECGTRYMEAQPYLKPAFDAVKEGFKTDIVKALKDG